MTLEELGASLRLEREKRGLQLEDVADHLKIGARLLRALEEGDRAALPHLAYARGFVRSYAAYLGMSVDEVNAALQALSQVQTAPVQPVFAQRGAQRRAQRKGNGLAWVMIFVLLAAGGGIYAAWEYGWLSRQQEPRLAQPAPPLPTPEAADSASETPPGNPPVSQAEPAAEKTSAVPTRLAQPDASVREEQTAVAESPLTVQPQAAPVQVEEPTAQGVLPGGQHKVIITATEECWIHSNADNTDTRQFSLRRGDTFALTFTKTLKLKLGNAGGVRIRYNGQEMPAPGTSGQVRTLHFPPAVP